MDQAVEHVGGRRNAAVLALLLTLAGLAHVAGIYLFQLGAVNAAHWIGSQVGTYASLPDRVAELEVTTVDGGGE